MERHSGKRLGSREFEPAAAEIQSKCETPKDELTEHSDYTVEDGVLRDDIAAWAETRVARK